MSNADVLFLSDENINENKEEFIRKLQEKYGNKVVVMGRGSDGSLMLYENKLIKMSAIGIGNVKNSCGAGDALFSCFIHFYLKGIDPIECLKNATLFATYKIGFSGGSNGFLKEKDLLTLKEKVKFNYTVE